MKLLRWSTHGVSIVVLVVSLGACALAQSGRDSQRPSQPQRDTQSANQPPATDPRGTAATPFVVKVQPTKKTDAETAKEQRDEKNQTSDRRWTRSLAVVTAFLGLLQLIAIGFQVWIARRQNTIINSQSDIMDKQRDAADAQSGYMREGLEETRSSIKEAARNTAAMESIAESMARQAVMLNESLAISADIARTQRSVFVSQNRARLQVMNWKVFRIIDEFPETLATDRDCAFRYFIKNVGSTTATLHRVDISAPSIACTRTDDVDQYLDADHWTQRMIPFVLPKDEEAMTVLGQAFTVQLQVFYSDDFATRKKSFCRTTWDHVQALTLSDDKKTEQEWWVCGGTAGNAEFDTIPFAPRQATTDGQQAGEQ